MAAIHLDAIQEIWKTHNTPRYFIYASTVRLSTKRFGANLTLTRYDDGNYGLRFYDTEIVRFTEDGWIITTDKWDTPVTFRRIWSFTGLNIRAIGAARSRHLSHYHEIGPVWVDHVRKYIPFEEGQLIPYDRDLTGHGAPVPTLTRKVPAPKATRRFTQELEEILESLRPRFYLGEFDESMRTVGHVGADLAVDSWEDLLRCARTGVMADPWDVTRLVATLRPDTTLPLRRRGALLVNLRDDEVVFRMLHRRMHYPWLEQRELLVGVPA